MIEKDNSFLRQVRDLLSGVESGEYEMQNASLAAPVADVSTEADKFRRCEHTGHIFVTMLLYKRPEHQVTSPETANSTSVV